MDGMGDELPEIPCRHVDKANISPSEIEEMQSGNYLSHAFRSLSGSLSYPHVLFGDIHCFLKRWM